MKLYHHPISGHAHRVRLFLGFLSLEHELVEVDLVKGAHKSPEFLKLNPLGQVPVLQDGDTVITDSNAIMVYLAKKTGATNWLPEDAEGTARVQRWLSIAAGEIAFGPAAARRITLFGAPFNANEVLSRAHAVLGNIEDHLKTHSWLAASHPTIADVAVYSYVARAPEGKVDLTAYGKVRDWLKRIEELPGFVPFMHAPEEMLASA